MKTPLCLAAAFAFTGCYTQLYTGGYAQRTVEPTPYYGYSEAAPDTGSDSSRAAAGQRDTLVRPSSGSGTVIVNNYYHESPYYRGYALDAWDYPYVSFGFYSGRYRDYCDPYWWHDSRYHRGYYRDYSGGTIISSGGSSPYHSDKRIFAPAPSQPQLRKGRRADPAQAAPAPAPAPAPKIADPGPSAAPAESTGSGSKSDDQESSSNGSGNDHPTLHKGRRR